MVLMMLSIHCTWLSMLECSLLFVIGILYYLRCSVANEFEVFTLAWEWLVLTCFFSLPREWRVLATMFRCLPVG